MELTMGIMQTATSGMKAQANRLGTVGDNIANASTTGYKKVSTEFSALVLPSGKGSYNSGGVETTVRRAVSLEGGTTYTTSTTDLAIRGKGFFIVEDSSGGRFLTRAGSFVQNADGYLVNAAGYYLVGYQASDAGVLVNSLNGGERVNVNSINMQATPTQNIGGVAGVFAAKLPVDAAIVPAGSLPSDNVAGSAFSAMWSMTVYDNVGREVKLDLYFAKTAAGAWELSVFNGTDGGGFPYDAAEVLGTTPLTFDATGNLATPATGLTANITIPGGQTVNLDISGLKQLAGDSEIIAAQVNGNGPSAVDDVSIGADGVITFQMTDGSAIDAYRIAIADVPSPDNLRALSGGVFQVSNESGDPVVGFPNQGGLGSLLSSALESSNVDLAEELATMIEAQRNYTANSKVFQTGAEVLEVLVNLKR
ncbi:MAG: flagellar hook protein FlgE [Pseudochelatococcus sp.]|uniref:flagellar hook protein FlgE n=1 Tax=Pseudochelatococcus sp. TaxID=2020869 RepID=UPI003D91ECA6